MIVAMVGGLASSREKLGTFSDIGDMPVAFEFVAYRVLLVALFMLAIFTAVAVANCREILAHCALLTAVPS